MLVLDSRVSATGAIAGAVVGNIGSVLLAITTCPSCLYYSLLATYCFPLAAYYLLPTTYYLLLQGDRVDRGRGHREQRHCLRRRELRGRHARHAQAALTLTLTLKPR